MKCIINMANWLRDECTEVNSHHPCNPQDLTIKLVLLFYRNVSWTSIKGKGQITEEFSASAIQCSQQVQCCSGVFVVNFKHSHIFFWCFCCWFWTGKCLLRIRLLVMGFRVSTLNPSRPSHFRKLYWSKNELKFLFSHFFVVPQKVLWRPYRASWNLLRHHKEVWK